MTIFLDTNLVIYRVEMPRGFGARALACLNALEAAGHTFAVSDLVRMECRVLPVRNSNLPVLAAFDAFFSSANVLVLPLTSAVCDRATHLRAILNFKVADALQLAAAIVHGCDRFLTADARLSSCPDIPVDILP